MEGYGDEGAGALTRKVLAFQRTGRGLDDLVGDLSLRIYRFPRVRRGCTEDDCGDFYLFFFPRLIKILGRFQDQGKPFESYLHSVLGWQLRSFVRRKRQEQRRWEAACLPGFWGEAGAPVVAELQADAGELSRLRGLAARLGLDGQGVIRRPSDRRRFLLSVLKRVRELGEAELEESADRIGASHAELQRQARELLARLSRREARLARLRERRNRAFGRLTLLEQQRAEETDGEKARGLEQRIRRLRQRLHATQGVIARIPLQPSNRDLGEVLGIPKGSVDTSLYWLRHRLQELDGAEDKEYA